MRAAAFALTWILTTAASPAERRVGTSETPDTTRLWPCRLVVKPPLLNVVQDGWQRSPTLQRQCRRLADAGAVVDIAWGKTDSYARAATRIGRDSNGVIVAMISVPPVSDVIELVAHELEHVLEWVDGRDLPGEARRRGSGVWSAFGGFETQRAIDTGRQAAREVEESRRRGGPTVNTEFLNALPSLSLDGRIFGGSCEPNVSPVKAGGSLDLRPFASGTIKPRHPQRVPDAPLRNALEFGTSWVQCSAPLPGGCR